MENASVKTFFINSRTYKIVLFHDDAITLQVEPAIYKTKFFVALCPPGSGRPIGDYVSAEELEGYVKRLFEKAYEIESREDTVHHFVPKVGLMDLGFE